MVTEVADTDRAYGQNAVWRRKLGTAWPGKEQLAAVGVTADLTTDEAAFIQEVACYQYATGLDPDGVLGPKTAAAIVGECYQAPTGTDHIVVGGRNIPIQAKVISPEDAGGLAFRECDRGAWRREAPVTMGCIHAKGAEGGALGTWSYLRAKGYGVHFTIERDGTLWQYADPVALATAHAGRINEASFGIEMTNQIMPTYPNKYARPIIQDTYIGRVRNSFHFGQRTTRTIQGMLQPQLATLVAVLDVLCSVLSIPKQIPTVDGHYWAGLMPDLRSGWNNQVVGRMIPFTGILGHLNVTNAHIDPSGDVFAYLLAHGYAGVPV